MSDGEMKREDVINKLGAFGVEGPSARYNVATWILAVLDDREAFEDERDEALREVAKLKSELAEAQAEDAWKHLTHADKLKRELGESRVEVGVLKSRLLEVARELKPFGITIKWSGDGELDIEDDRECAVEYCSEMEKVKAELEDAKRERDDAWKKSARSSSDALAAEMRCVNLTSQLETSRDMFDSAIKNLENARAEVDSLKAELAESHKAIRDLKCVAPNKDATIGELRDEIAELRRALKESGGDPDAFQQTVGFAAAAQSRELANKDAIIGELRAIIASAIGKES